MKNWLRMLRNVVVVLLIMIGTAALTVWFVTIRDRRRATRGQPENPPTVARNVMASTAASVATVKSPEGDFEWSREEIRELREHVRNRTILALLELLHDRGGDPVNYHELMNATGRTMPQVRADLAVFSRAVKKIENHEKWPISITNPTDNQSRIAYTVPKTYLDWWFEE